VRYQWINAEKVNHSIQMMCRALKVSRSGYYAFVRREPAPRTQQDLVLTAEIEKFFKASRKAYGSPRIHQDLQAAGHRVGRHRVARLMRSGALCARKKLTYRSLPSSDPGVPPQPNLLDRRFTQTKANLVWVTDLTGIRTLEGWLYVVAFLDLFSRRIVGWRSGSTADAALCVAAFNDAVYCRRPSSGLIVHSDQGTQFTSVLFQESVVRIGGASSMSRRGNCWDNAPMESFWSSLKTEMDNSVPATRRDAQRRVFDFIDAFYNPHRRHSSLGYLSPAQFEKQAALSSAA
jgi:putative transposase